MIYFIDYYFLLKLHNTWFVAWNWVQYIKRALCWEIYALALRKFLTVPQMFKFSETQLTGKKLHSAIHVELLCSTPFLQDSTPWILLSAASPITDQPSFVILKISERVK
jgi:hypothetical protein